MTLEREIDALYQLPLAEFTPARNLLAKTLKGEEGKQVRALAKPTVVPWAVNQLFWQARPTYDRLMTCGQALRAAQLTALEHPSGTGAELARAAESHKTALADAVRQAARLAAAASSRPDTDDLARTLESLSLSATAPEHPGRLTEAVRPAGFEALAGLTLTPPAPLRFPGSTGRPPDRPRQPSGSPPKPAARQDRVDDAGKKAEALAERQREQELAAGRRKAEAAVASAERELERARTAEREARESLEAAERAREEARDRLAAARKFLISNF